MTARFVLRRLALAVPTVAGIILVAFFLIHAAPGDPVLAIAGEHGDAEYYAFMRERFGLDQPVLGQLATYFSRVAAGDLGQSFVHGRGTAEVILERAPATLLLTGTALTIAIIASIPLGALAARRPNSAGDLGINAAALALDSAPAFWVAQMAIIVAAIGLGLVPVQGMTDAGRTTVGLERVADIARHLVLPALVLASHEMAVLIRLTRSGLIDELGRDHIRTARAKGVSERSVLLRHAMRRAIVPAISVIGARVGHLLAGAAVVEIVFGWPGIGRLLLTSLQTRDTPILLGIFMVVALMVVVANLITDLVHAALDPRVSNR